MALALLKENERLFTQAFEAPASVRLGRGLLAIWRSSRRSAKAASRLLADSLRAKSKIAEFSDAQLLGLDLTRVLHYQEEFIKHLEHLEEYRAKVMGELNRSGSDLQVEYDRLLPKTGLVAWFVHWRVMKSLSAIATMDYAFANYIGAVEFLLAERINPAISVMTGNPARRVISIADRQFSAERQAAIRARIAKPTAEELEWGREVSRRLDLR